MKRYVYTLFFGAILVLTAWYLVERFWVDKARDVGLNEIVDAIKQGQIVRIEVRDTEILAYSQEDSLRAYKENSTSIYEVLRLAGLSDQLISTLSIEVIPSSIINKRDLALVMPYVLLVAALVFFFYFIMQSNKATTTGFNEWKDAPGKIPETKFKDIAGYQQTKRELMELVEYLRSPEVFKHLGAEIPRNVLLVGPPGTGKTQFARAVANSAGAHVFYGSGSQFVELFVGVGASRVRSLFQQAKAKTPSVVFIDELDALARKRAPAASLSTQEHDNTLNELLSQLDGFLEDKERVVIFIGATNREEVLDSALVQRMNRKIYVDLPKPFEREGILQIHARDQNLAWSESDIKNIVEQTAGFSGRELKEIIHESPRQTYQRLIQEAIESSKSHPDTDIVLPVSDQVVESPVQLTGRCYPGTSVIVKVGSFQTTIDDEDNDGIWVTLMGLAEGKHDIKVTWEKDQNGKPQTKSRHFQVGKKHYEIGTRDVNAALRRLGIHIPKIDFRDGVVDAALRQLIMGQNNALGSLVTAAAMHYNRARLRIDHVGARTSKSHVLLIGPSGVGKTHMARSLAKVLDVPFAVADMEVAGTLSAVASEPFRKLLAAANGITQKAQFGIISIQGFDGLSGKDPQNGSLWRSSAQEVLYSLMEGDKLDVPVMLDGANPRTVSINTENIFFVCEGNFNSLLKEIKEKRGTEKLRITHEDLLAFGFSADLMGCISAIIVMDELSPNNIAALFQSENPDNLLSEYEQFLSEQGVSVIFSPQARHGIASEVLHRGVGVRVVNAVMHKICQYILENRDVLDRQESGELLFEEEHLRNALSVNEEIGPKLNLEHTKEMSPEKIMKDVLGLEEE